MDNDKPTAVPATPINSGNGATPSVDENAAPFLREAPPAVDLSDFEVDNTIPEEIYRPVAHRLEDLIAETNVELDRIKKFLSILQILVSVCAAAAVIYIAAKTKKGTVTV